VVPAHATSRGRGGADPGPRAHREPQSRGGCPVPAALRQIEADPANLKTVQTGTKRVDTGIVGANGQPILQTVPVMEDIPLPVDLRPVKAALAPMRGRHATTSPLDAATGEPGFKAITQLLDEPDFVKASVAEADLGGLKSVVRGAVDPNLRNISQGTSARAVSELERAVQAAVAQAGPAAVDALKAGRLATRAKYLAADVLKGFGKQPEPVRVVKRLTARDDTAVTKLRAFAREAPQAVPQVGRAVLEEILAKGKEQTGGITRTDGMFRAWQNLGPETKRVLFRQPGLVADLDRFFLLVKKLGENPNPSGTGYIVSLIGKRSGCLREPVSGTLLQVTAQDSRSSCTRRPVCVRSRARLKVTPATNTLSATAVFGQIQRAAADAGVSLRSAKPALPLAADEGEPDR